MKEYSIKELADFVNAINKNEDAAIEVSVGQQGGIVGAVTGGSLSVKITPPVKATAPAQKVLYLCDKRDVCPQCSEECDHTTDIAHARNFERLTEGVYIEKAAGDCDCDYQEELDE